MIRDLDSGDIAPGLTCDICIVGTGLVGLALLRELAGSGLSIVALESGGASLEDATTALTDADVVGRPFPGTSEGRVRRFGGTSWRWGGQALPLDPIDFRERDWLPGVCWPFGRAEVDPFYRRAAAFLAIDDDDFSQDVFAPFRFTPPLFDPSLLHLHVAKWAPRPQVSLLYKDTISRSTNIDVLLHANLVRLDLDDAGRADVAFARSLSGATIRIRAAAFVLAAGAIENARLLLASDHQRPEGLGNRTGLVGRYLQDHPSARIGTLSSADERGLQRVFNMFYRNGRKYSVRVSTTDAFQTTHRTPAMSCGFAFEEPAAGPVTRAKAAVHALREKRTGAWRDVLAAAGGVPGLVAPAAAYLLFGRAYVPRAPANVVINTEQEPDPDSRVTLGTNRDALGLPVACVTWKVRDSTGRAIRIFSEVLRDEIARLRLGTLRLDDWVLNGGDGWSREVHDAYHHMGTTRMSADPATGVVDPHGRVHDIPNLFVAGASTFPSGGHSNPTFTAIALAFRLADHLRHAGTVAVPDVGPSQSVDAHAAPTASVSRAARSAGDGSAGVAVGAYPHAVSAGFAGAGLRPAGARAYTITERGIR